MMMSGVALISTSLMVRMSANAPFHMAENAMTGSYPHRRRMSALTRSASRIAAIGVSTAPTARRTRRAHRGDATAWFGAGVADSVMVCSMPPVSRFREKAR